MAYIGTTKVLAGLKGDPGEPLCLHKKIQFGIDPPVGGINVQVNKSDFNRVPLISEYGFGLWENGVSDDAFMVFFQVKRVDSETVEVAITSETKITGHEGPRGPEGYPGDASYISHDNPTGAVKGRLEGDIITFSSYDNTNVEGFFFDSGDTFFYQDGNTIDMVCYGSRFKLNYDSIRSTIDMKARDININGENININGEPIGTGIDTPIATTSTAGKVKPDGNTITISEDGTISVDIEKLYAALNTLMTQ